MWKYDEEAFNEWVTAHSKWMRGNLPKEMADAFENELESLLSDMDKQGFMFFHLLHMSTLNKEDNYDYWEMAQELNDYQDSEHFSYNRTWEEILAMLDKAERHQNQYFSKLQRTKDKKERMKCMRNYKALEGVVKALRWTLGDKNIEHPLE